MIVTGTAAALKPGASFRVVVAIEAILTRESEADKRGGEGGAILDYFGLCTPHFGVAVSRSAVLRTFLVFKTPSSGVQSILKTWWHRGRLIIEDNIEFSEVAYRIIAVRRVCRK